MAGWSILANGSALDCVETEKKCQTNGCHLDVDVTEGSVEKSGVQKDRLRYLFDLVLSGYLKDVAIKGFVRPLPALLGKDGQSPDLLKLFLLVNELGGYDFVSKRGFWGFVVTELGLDLEVSASVKLIYVKYLNELEKWLCNLEDRNGQGASVVKYGFLSLEQEKELRGLLTNVVDRKVAINRLALVEYIKNKKFLGKVAKKNGLKISDANLSRRVQNGVEKRFSDDDEKLCRNDLAVLDPTVARKEFCSRKRKRESLTGMLNWLIQVAKYPKDPSIGAILEPSKWKDHGGNEFWIQVIRAREALRRKRDDHSLDEQSLLQNNQKVHPSMYEDDFLSRHFTERLRCSERLQTPKSCSCSFCVPGSASKKNLLCHKEKSRANLKSLDMIADDTFRRYVAVGPRFQAEIPEWTGLVLDTDSKWLGTREWPLNGQEHNSLAVVNQVGRGRPDSCGCQIPGSVECIRLHIAEKRMKLKLELGSVFYRWRFNEMGEEVSLRWTADEEKRFKCMVHLEPPSLNKFWPDAFKIFPRKTRQELVSYFFNVFLIRRRRYQNHVTPKSIDSDDDEADFGYISDSFGSDALNVPGSNMMICLQNNQCIDF